MFRNYLSYIPYFIPYCGPFKGVKLYLRELIEILAKIDNEQEFLLEKKKFYAKYSFDDVEKEYIFQLIVWILCQIFIDASRKYHMPHHGFVKLVQNRCQMNRIHNLEGFKADALIISRKLEILIGIDFERMVTSFYLDLIEIDDYQNDFSDL